MQRTYKDLAIAKEKVIQNMCSSVELKVNARDSLSEVEKKSEIAVNSMISFQNLGSFDTLPG